ncbi:MAG TPA: hypothetical protein VJQ25_07875, partial [Nitrospira sp.]|nr:hypothetical protein [Nitrospira sp.]
MFDSPAVRRNENIVTMIPQHGGHCGFFQSRGTGRDRFWAEQKILEFLSQARSAIRRSIT